MAVLYEALAARIAKPKVATFVKVDVEAAGARDVAGAYGVSTQPAALPTLLVFRDGRVAQRVPWTGDAKKMLAVFDGLDSEIQNTAAEGSGGGGSAMVWSGADLPRGYADISDCVDVRGLELLNADAASAVRTLFRKAKPAALGGDGGEAEGEGAAAKDWVESDTDEQLMLFAPFNSAVKLHTLQVRRPLPPAHPLPFPLSRPRQWADADSRGLATR